MRPNIKSTYNLEDAILPSQKLQINVFSADIILKRMGAEACRLGLIETGAARSLPTSKVRIFRPFLVAPMDHPRIGNATHWWP